MKNRKDTPTKFQFAGKEVSLSFIQRNPKHSYDDAIEAVKDHFNNAPSAAGSTPEEEMDSWNGRDFTLPEHRSQTGLSIVRITVS